MINITTTELNKSPGMYLDTARRDSVVVKKAGRPFVVLVAYEKYMEFENAFWGKISQKSRSRKIYW